MSIVNIINRPDNNIQKLEQRIVWDSNHRFSDGGSNPKKNIKILDLDDLDMVQDQ